MAFLALKTLLPKEKELDCSTGWDSYAVFDQQFFTQENDLCVNVFLYFCSAGKFGP